MVGVVEAAFAAVPRVAFLPAAQRQFADLDVPLPIGFSVTNSQPTTVRNMLNLLRVRRGQNVLDVGSGSGWTTALLAHIVGATGTVVGVERIPDLVERSSAALSGFPQVSVHHAVEGQLGWPQRGPYDRILVSAMAETVPVQLTKQPGPGGIMVIPVNDEMLRVVKSSGGELAVSSHGGYTFVPLIQQ